MTTAPGTPRLGYAAVAGALVIGVSVLRLLYALPLDAVPDEADKWVWSQHLDYGYYDQPPLLMWLLAAAEWVLGSGTLALRVVPALLGALTASYLFRLGRDIVGDRLALHAVVLINLMPLYVAGGMLATPDTPMVAALCAASFHFHRALTGGRMRSWMLTGLWTGLALLSKFVAVLIGLSFLLCLLLPEHRRWLTRVGPYAAAAIALALFSPVVLWNASHDWVAFAFQWQHGLGASKFPQWSRPPEYIASQALVVGPVVFGLFLATLLGVVRRWRDQPQGLRLLWCLAAVPFLFFLGSSFFKKVEANWASFAYVPGVLLMLGHYQRSLNRTLAGRLSWRIGWGTNAVALAAVLVHVYVPLVPLRRDRADDFFGWRQLGHEAVRVASRHPKLVPAANNYQYAGELRLYSGLPVVSLNVESRPNQYDLWQDRAEREGRRFLLFARRPVEESAIGPGLDRWRHLETLTLRGRGGRVVRTVFVYEVTLRQPREPRAGGTGERGSRQALRG